MKKYSSYFKIALIIAIIIATIIPTIALGNMKSDAIGGGAVKKIDINETAIKEVTLPVLGSYENLKKLLEENEKNTNIMYGGLRRSGVIFTSGLPVTAKENNVAMDGAAQKSLSASNNTAADYSTTNVQVQGVDEADVVKTDGEYIYYVSEGKIVIMKAYPVKDMKVESIINYSDNKFSPFEMYMDSKHLVVVGSYYDEVPITYNDSIKESNNSPVADKGTASYVHPPTYSRSMVKAIVYDIENKKYPKQLREIEIEGGYVSSRKIDSRIYFVTNKYIDYYLLRNEDIMGKEVFSTPVYRDSRLSKDYVNVDYSKISYFHGVIEPNYMIIAGLNIDNLSENLNVQTYLGAGQNVYVSENNLYAAAVNYKTEDKVETETQVNGNEKASIWIRPSNYITNTVIYRFSLKDGIKCTGKGEVPGTTLNQFSMDESNGYFRVATTKGETWRSDENTSKNNLYVLDDNMGISGKIEDIAPGEMIYSVRFMGDRAYMVTFRTVDPLFVIDLKDPKNPKILGKLKIPGYSNYLHPYDENHIIGFGKDAVEVANKDEKGNVVGTSAYYLGMKIAIFDVTDVNNPIEEFKTTIGGRGTDSELLNNHRALLFSKEKNLLAFPVTVMEANNNSSLNKMPDYGRFTFQGAYIYNIDLEKGMTLKGKVSHITEEDYLKSGDNWYYGSNKNVQRILYIGDVLYTISNNKLMAHDIKNINRLGEILIPIK
ncbi:MAG: secreted protein [Clostridiales bacterium]|nr:secreted protein [Clostridiales bacterium]